MVVLEVTIESSGLKLRGHVGLPGPGGRNLGVVLCHGFPSGARGAATAAATFPELADRVARGGWPALAFNLRGTGASEGDFDADGWLADLRAGVRFLVLRGDVAGVCIIGFAEGGTLAVCEAADDDLVVGVAAVSAPLRMGEWASHPARLLDHMRRVGMVRTPDFPPDPLAWGRSVGALDAQASATRLAPRPLLVLHGSEDEVVSTEDARALADAAAPKLGAARGARRRLAAAARPPGGGDAPRLGRALLQLTRRRPGAAQTPARAAASTSASVSSNGRAGAHPVAARSLEASATSAGTSTGRTSAGSTSRSRSAPLAPRSASATSRTLHPRPEPTL